MSFKDYIKETTVHSSGDNRLKIDGLEIKNSSQLKKFMKTASAEVLQAIVLELYEKHVSNANAQAQKGY